MNVITHNLEAEKKEVNTWPQTDIYSDGSKYLTLNCAHTESA